MSRHKLQLSIEVPNDDLKDASWRAFHQFGELMVGAGSAPFFELTSTSDLGVLESNVPTPLKIRWGTPFMGMNDHRYPDPEWPDGWPLPKIGQSVYLKDRKFLVVTAIDWHPYGEDGSEPFVYVVLNEHRIGARY